MEGTCLLINERLFVLKEVHREMIGVSSENSEVKVSENCWRSSSTPEISAFFHRYTSLFGGFCLSGMTLTSVRTMSWSLKPGIEVHLLTSVGLLVMNMSSVFSRRVGKVTTCSAQMSCTTLTKAVLIGKL